MIINCHTRGEFNLYFNRILDAIERAAAKKKNKDSQTNDKEEKTDDKSFEKETKKGFATKEEADEYARRKQAEDEVSDEKKNSSFTSSIQGKDYSSRSEERRVGKECR